MIEMSVKVNGKKVYVYPLPLEEKLSGVINNVTGRDFGMVVDLLARRLVDLEDMFGDNASLLDESGLSGLVLRRDMGMEQGLLLAVYRDKRDLLGLLEIIVSMLRKDLELPDIYNLTVQLIKTIKSYKSMLDSNE